MPCDCSSLAPCEVPQLVPVPYHSASHAIVFEGQGIDFAPQLYEDGNLSPESVVVGLALLIVALSRHFRSRPPCVLNLSGRPASEPARASRPGRPPRRPFRLVL